MNHYLFKYSFCLINNFLKGKRVTSVSVHSVSSFSIHFRESKRSIYVDLAPQNAFIYPFDKTPPSLKNISIPLFAFLKKKLPGFVLSGTKQRGSERVGHLLFEDVRGDIAHHYRLIVEMVGRIPNAVFTTGDLEILQAYRNISTGREIMPHKRYEQPIIDMPDLLYEDIDKLKLRYRYSEDILGFDGGLRRLVKSEDEFVELVRIIRETFDKGEFKLCLHGKRDLYPFRFSKACKEVDEDFLYERFVLKPKESEFENRRRNLRGILMRRLKSLRKRLSKIEIELEASEDAQLYRIMAENLLANPSLDVRYKDSITLTDVYTSKPIEIPLNPKLSLFDNAQNYFKRYKKALKSKHIVEERKKETQMEMEFVEQLLFDVENAKTESDLDDIRDMMIKEGIIRAAVKKKQPSQAYLPYEHKVIGGFDVYIGKNARGNDYVTLRLASRNDLWFHAHGRAGAHLILRNPSRLQNIDESVKILCAKEVAKRTKASPGEKIEVAYTFVRHVRKPKGFKTGMVLYTNFKTIVVAKE